MAQFFYSPTYSLFFSGRRRANQKKAYHKDTITVASPPHKVLQYVLFLQSTETDSTDYTENPFTLQNFIGLPPMFIGLPPWLSVYHPHFHWQNSLWDEITSVPHSYFPTDTPGGPA